MQKSQEFKQNLQKFFEFEDPNRLSSKSRHFLKALSTFESSKKQENQEIID